VAKPAPSAPAVELAPPQNNAILESVAITEVKSKVKSESAAEEKKAKDEADARKALRAQIV
jgi:hypothetical protein